MRVFSAYMYACIVAQFSERENYPIICQMKLKPNIVNELRNTHDINNRPIGLYRD